MKARELMEELFAQADEPVRDTVDTCKAGDPERALRRVATCFIATPEVIRAAGTGARTCSSRTSRPTTSTATTWARSRTTP